MNFLLDPKLKTRSVTVTFNVASFVLAVSSIVSCHFFPGVLPATTSAIVLFVICMVFYRIRKIDDLKLNVKTGDIEIKDNP